MSEAQINQEPESSATARVGSSLSWWLLVLGLVLLSCGQVSESTDHPVTHRESCSRGSEFTCISLKVPLDHFDPNDLRTIEVTFAVHPASADPQGVLVTAVGGPGVSGLSEADLQLSVLDSSIVERFDLVFFDQRGVGMLEDPICSRTEQAAEAGEPPPRPPRPFITRCIEESSYSDVIVHLDTDQAIRDLELFRQAMGYERLTLYGRSYGTRFVQTYASEYPNAVERIVLDAPVDRTRDVLESIDAQSAADDVVIQEVLAACDSDAECSSDLGMPAQNAYEQLRHELTSEPTEVSYPVLPSVWEKIPFTAEDLSQVAFESAYSEDGRMMFVRALAAATRDDDLLPMTGFLVGGGNNSDDEFASAMLNMAINCPDMSIPGDDLASESSQILNARAADLENQARYGPPLSCIHWPEIDHGRLPAEPFEAVGIPTMVVAAELDPATPYTGAISVAEHLDDGHLLTVHGGSHVMFGRFDPCVDEAVTEFIVRATPPPITCEAGTMDHYVPLLPDQPGERSTTELLPIVDTELFNWVLLTGIDVTEETDVSCPGGGSVFLRATEVGGEFELDRCGLNEVVTVTGEGSWDFLDEVSRYRVSFGDDCYYSYARWWDDGSENIEPSCPLGE